MFRESIRILLLESALLLITVCGWVLFNQSEFLIVTCILITVIICTIYFFRDPERPIPEGANLFVSPADGTVVDITELPFLPVLGGPAKRITIYLSLWDVHVNRVPISGHVTDLEYHQGQYLCAYKGEASRKNEHTMIGIVGSIGKVCVKQIAGMIARRIVCRLKVGDTVQKGERFGMIKFGSRVELYFSDSITVQVSKGDKVRGGESILGVKL